MEYQLDINCDLGEGYGNDHLIMPYINSCNIACGGHAGNTQTMEETLKLAQRHEVRAGAHPSYPDRENFGREVLDINEDELYESISDQTKSLLTKAKELGVKVWHVKPHGALYNKAATNEHTARLIVKMIQRIDPSLILYAPCNSELERIGRIEGLKVWSEAFLDRNYNQDLTLVPRDHPEALLNDVERIKEQLLKMVMKNELLTVNGKEVEINAQTYCIHGDNPVAPNILKALGKELKNKNIRLK